MINGFIRVRLNRLYYGTRSLLLRSYPIFELILWIVFSIELISVD